MLRLKGCRLLCHPGLILAVLMILAGVFSSTRFLAASSPWQVYSSREPVLRLHVIAASDKARDQLIKEQVVAVVKEQLGRAGPFSSVEDCRNHTRCLIPSLEKEIKAYLQGPAPGQQVSVELARSDFPLRVYGTRVFAPGRYPALKVVLGPGQGENWWCLLFPSLCIPPVETESSAGVTVAEGEEKTKIMEGTDLSGREKPVERRWFIWEWWQRLQSRF